MSPGDLTEVARLQAEFSIHALDLEVPASGRTWGPGGINTEWMNEAGSAGIVAKQKCSRVR